jgi:hypothetical protein
MLPVWFDLIAVAWSVLLVAGIIGYGMAMKVPAVSRRKVLRSEECHVASPLPKQRVLEAA